MTAENTLSAIQEHLELDLIHPVKRNASYEMVLARCVFVLLLFKRGCTAPELAGLLKINRCSIYYYRNRAVKMLNKEDQFFASFYAKLTAVIQNHEKQAAA